MKRLRFPLSALLLLVTFVAATLWWRVSCARIVERLERLAGADDPEAAAILLDADSRVVFHEYWTKRFGFRLEGPPMTRWSAAMRGVPAVRIEVRYRLSTTSNIIGVNVLEGVVRPWGITGLKRIEQREERFFGILNYWTTLH